MLFYLFFFFFKLSTGLMDCHSQIALQSINFNFCHSHADCAQLTCGFLLKGKQNVL